MPLFKLSVAVGICFAAAVPLNAQVLWSDDFSSYTPGDLDANEAGGPNQAPNGGPGNPWCGAWPGNLAVASSFNGITPYQGAANLVDGQGPNLYMWDFVNIGYRANGGKNFRGGIRLSWAFYDPAGAGASGYNDIVYLNGYQGADGYTSTADYTAMDAGSGGPTLQWYYTGGDEILGLGANNPGGADPGAYQARLLAASAANHGATYTGANGWFNLNVARSVGWHTAAIELGPDNGDNTTVTFYMDGQVVLEGTTGPTVGVNTIAANSGWGDQVGAFDAFALTVVSPAQSSHITSISGPTPSGTVTIHFTGDPATPASAFRLLGSGTVNGTYSPASGANITGSAGAFTATVPANGAQQFYKIQQ